MTTTEQNPILIDVPMPIRTPRLLLRPVQAGDGAPSHAAKVETLDDLQRWMPWAKDGPGAVDETEIVVRQGHADFILRQDIFLVGIGQATGQPVIWCGLHRFDWKVRRFEIGYWVRKSAQGKGYATEMTNALTRYAFGALAARRVEITHAEGNVRSGAVPTKLGFVKEAVHSAASLLPDGSVVDQHRYARIDLHGMPPLDVRWGQT